jgi:NAD(P)-dependent dehydrogenase (short-subunit alcohol dehydrogenase family)
VRADTDFAGKGVIVTGAAGGIGRALCFRFGQAGARIAALDRDAEGLRDLARDLEKSGIESFSQICDVTDAEQCAAAMASVTERLEGVDVLINNAGITHRSPFLETDLSVYRRVIEVNVFGALHCTKAAMKSLLERRGLIIVLSSIAGFSPLPARTGYCASKHALHGLFETLRCELADQGVRVMMVCPGFTATKIDRSALDGKGGLASHPWSPVGKVATPESVAEAVYRGARSGRRILVLSRVGRASRLVSRLLPGVYERTVTRMFRRDVNRKP